MVMRKMGVWLFWVGRGYLWLMFLVARRRELLCQCSYF